MVSWGTSEVPPVVLQGQGPNRSGCVKALKLNTARFLKSFYYTGAVGYEWRGV